MGVRSKEGMTVFRRYFFIVLLGLPVVASAEWRFEDSTDPFTDETNMVAGWVDNSSYMSPKQITVRCSGDELDVMFRLGDFVGDGRQSRDLTYRFDKGETQKAKWQISTTGRSIFFLGWSADAKEVFAKQLMASGQVAVRADDHQNTPLTAIFPLKGSAGPISRVLAGCGLGETAE